MPTSRSTHHRSGRAAPACALLALAASLACGAALAAGPNLVTNGSFETNTGFGERPDVPRVADLSGSVPTGWSRDAGDQAEYMVRTPAYQGLTIYNPTDGDYFIGAHDGEWWEQSFATVAGTSYTLSYASAYGSVWWLNFGGYYRPGVQPGQLTLTGNALLLAASVAGTAPAPTGSTLLDAPFVWAQHSVSFVADSGQTTLRFAGSTVQDGGFIFIDDVTVTGAVPEPPGTWLLLLGLPAVWLARRRAMQGRAAQG